MDTTCLLLRTKSGLIGVENDSGLLLALAILNDSAPMAEKTILHGTLLDLSGILTIEKRNESLLSKRPKRNFPFFYLMFKSKKLASYLSVFSLSTCNSSGYVLE